MARDNRWTQRTVGRDSEFKPAVYARTQDWVVTYIRRGGVLLFGIGLLLIVLSVNAL